MEYSVGYCNPLLKMEILHYRRVLHLFVYKLVDNPECNGFNSWPGEGLQPEDVRANVGGDGSLPSEQSREWCNVGVWDGCNSICNVIV